MFLTCADHLLVPLKVRCGSCVTAVPLWMQLSLVQECRGRVERAIASLVPEAGRSARQEMKLHAALGASLLFSKGPKPEIEAVWATALGIAESLEDTEYHLRALYGLWACRLNCGEFLVALTLAQRFYSLAQDRGTWLICRSGIE